MIQNNATSIIAFPALLPRPSSGLRPLLNSSVTLRGSEIFLSHCTAYWGLSWRNSLSKYTHRSQEELGDSRLVGLVTDWKLSGSMAYIIQRSVDELLIYTKEFRTYLCIQSTILLEIISDMQKVQSSAYLGLNQQQCTLHPNEGVHECVCVRVKGLSYISEALLKSKEMLICST